jgi:hypothetical protein
MNTPLEDAKARMTKAELREFKEIDPEIWADPGDRFLHDEEASGSYGELVRERDGWTAIVWVLGTTDRFNLGKFPTYQCAVDAIEGYEA